MSDVIFNFFDSVKSYFLIQQENASLNDFLMQKNFRLTPIGKQEIEMIQKIKSIKFNIKEI